MTALAERARKDKSPLPSMPEPLSEKMAPPGLLTMLKTLLRSRAAEHEVAAHMIATTEELLAFAIGRDARLQEGWRWEIFGQDAAALREGRLGFFWRNGSVETMPLAPPAT